MVMYEITGEDPSILAIVAFANTPLPRESVVVRGLTGNVR